MLALSHVIQRTHPDAKPIHHHQAERVTYDAYGQAHRHRPADLNGDGAVGPGDQAILLGAWRAGKFK